MAKLDGVNVVDMQGGEITKIAYGGEEYMKVDGVVKGTEVKDGDIGFTTGTSTGSTTAGSFYELIPHRYSDSWIRIKSDDAGTENGLRQERMAVYRKLAQPTKVSTPFAEMLSSKIADVDAKVDAVEKRVSALVSAEAQPTEITDGTRVKALRSGEFRNISAGEIGHVSVTGTDYEDDPYNIRVKNGIYVDYFRPQDLELASKVTLIPTVGDIVVITGESKFESRGSVNNVGDIGKISSEGDSGRSFAVKVPGKSTTQNHTAISELRLATDAEKAEYAKALAQAEERAAKDAVFTKAGRKPNEYRKGDVVRYLGNSSRKDSLAEVVEDAGASRVQIIMEPNRFAPKSTEYFESIEIVCFAEDRADIAKGGR